jgi:hypothetical protein
MRAGVRLLLIANPPQQGSANVRCGSRRGLSNAYFETPQNLIIIHHNVQVAAVGQSFIQSILESQHNYNARDRDNRFDVRAQTLQALSEHIVAHNPSIVGGTALDARQYMATGNAASVFGIKRGGRWRIYVNSRTGADYHTDLLYG